MAATLGCLVPALATVARAQGTRETTIFLVPSARTAPSGTPSFGTAVQTEVDSARTRVPLGMVFGLGRSLEAGVRLDDVFSAPSASDTSGLRGALKWRLVESWQWRVAITALGWWPLSDSGAGAAYGTGVRISWARQRSAVTAAADAWTHGPAEIGLALEHTMGSRGVVAIEAQKRGGTGQSVLSLRRALGENATVAVGGGVRTDGSRTFPVIVLAVGIVPRTAYLVARPPRPSRVPQADSVAERHDTTRVVPDLAAVLAREHAEDSVERGRTVTPMPALIPSEPAGGAVVWRRSAGAASAPSADDVRGLAALVLAARCPGSVDARIESGAEAGPERTDAVRRTLVLLGVAPDRITLLRGDEATGAGIVVRLSDAAAVRCPEQGPAAAARPSPSR